MLLLPLGRSRCSFGCFWRNASLLLHSVSFFSPSAASQPAPLLVPHSQLLWGFSSHQQRTSQDSERAVAKPAAAQMDSPRMGVALGSSLAAG